MTESSFTNRAKNIAQQYFYLLQRTTREEIPEGFFMSGSSFTQSRRYCGDSVVSSLNTRFTCVFNGAVHLEKASAELDFDYEKIQHSLNRNGSIGFGRLNFDLK